MSERDPADGPASLPFVRLFTDGACSGNPGPGGWAFILKHPASGKVVEASGGEIGRASCRERVFAIV